MIIVANFRFNQYLQITIEIEDKLFFFPDNNIDFIRQRSRTKWFSKEQNRETVGKARSINIHRQLPDGTNLQA